MAAEKVGSMVCPTCGKNVALERYKSYKGRIQIARHRDPKTAKYCWRGGFVVKPPEEAK